MIYRINMGRTNIVINETLIKKVMAITGAKSKREAVHIALERIVKRSSLFERLQKVKGKLHWEGDLSRWRKTRV